MALVVGLVATGCGGSDDEQDHGAASLNSGVSAEKVVSELTPAEADSLCRAYASYISLSLDEDGIKRGGCSLLGVVTSTDVASCELKVTDCTTSASESPVEMTTKCTTDPAERSACSATVSELEACYVEAIDVAKSFYSNLTCQTLMDALSGKAQFPVRADTPACKAIQDKCPQAYQPMTD